MLRFVLAALLALPMLALADITIFGLEIGKTTIEEVKEKYSAVTSLGVNKYTNGEMYFLPINSRPKDGDLKIVSATAVFSQDGKLVALLMKLSASEYDKVFKTIVTTLKTGPEPDPSGPPRKPVEFIEDNKYVIIPPDDPHGLRGPDRLRRAKFFDGNTQITLLKQPKVPGMQMNFVQKDVWQAFRDANRQ